MCKIKLMFMSIKLYLQPEYIQMLMPFKFTI